MNQQTLMGRCRSCQAPIWWRKNPSGKRQPMDYDLVTNTQTDMPHHATCPERGHWQGRGRTEQRAVPWWWNG
jgi:hypothetical protein